MQRARATILAFTMACFLAPSSEAGSHNTILIDRKDRMMSVVDEAGKTLIVCPIGIGRGPLADKVNMHDCITPTGSFLVDVVFATNPSLNQIDARRKRLISKNPSLAAYVTDESALAGVFKTMNAQDFNRDGKSDQAYGCGFIGLDGKNTGPKLIVSGRSARWYSIAIHGTPNEAKAIGNATSEGCIHVAKPVLQKLIESHLVGVGTKVLIKDGANIKFDVKVKSSRHDN